MPELLTLVRTYCRICTMRTLHILTNTGALDCLDCRAAGRETIQLINYPDEVSKHEQSKVA